MADWTEKRCSFCKMLTSSTIVRQKKKMLRIFTTNAETLRNMMMSRVIVVTCCGCFLSLLDKKKHLEKNITRKGTTTTTVAVADYRRPGARNLVMSQFILLGPVGLFKAGGVVEQLPPPGTLGVCLV